LANLRDSDAVKEMSGESPEMPGLRILAYFMHSEWTSRKTNTSLRNPSLSVGDGPELLHRYEALNENERRTDMNRRKFIGNTGCGLAAFMAAPGLAGSQNKDSQPPPPPKRRSYAIEIEIFEAREDTWCHKKGDKFAYPADWGKICPWLRTSLNDFVRILEFGGILPWKYEGTPYEKVIDPDGVTTEYVRCPDPTADLVAKITRTLKT
jgi:uncharacterized repeat protein (TIGR04076 family)